MTPAYGDAFPSASHFTTDDYYLPTAAEGEDWIALIPSIPKGTGSGERVGDEVQLKALWVKGTFSWLDEEATVHMMLIKRHLAYDGTAGVYVALSNLFESFGECPNTALRSRGWKKKGAGYKIIAHRVWQVTTLQTLVHVSFGLRFKQGRRPIIQFNNSGGGINKPNNTQYFVVLWTDFAADDDPSNHGVSFQNVTTRAQWYDC